MARISSHDVVSHLRKELSDMFEITDPRFSARMAAHIELSNQQAREASVDKVSLSMIDASCRYNVWLWAVTSKDTAEFETKRNQALEILLAETKRRFDTHFNDYAATFETEIVAQRPASENAQQS